MKQNCRNALKLIVAGICIVLMTIPPLSSAVLMSSKARILQNENITTYTNTKKDVMELTEKTGVKLLISDTSRCVLKNSINKDDLIIRSISVNDKTYQRISFPDCYFTTEVGKPELPVITAKVAIPKNVDITLTVTHAESTTLFSDTIYPVLESVATMNSEGVTSVDKKFCIDKTFYSKDIVYPGPLAKINGISFIRDLRIAQLEFYPIQYNPRSGELTVYSSIQVEVSYNNPVQPEDLMFPTAGPLDDICKRTILNYNSLPKDTSGSQRKNTLLPGKVTYPENLTDCTNTADYLIITSDYFYNAAKFDLPILSTFKPSVEIIDPNDGDTISRVAMIQGNAWDDDKIERVDIRFFRPCSPGWSYEDSIFFEDNHGKVSWKYKIAAPLLSGYTISVRAFDGAFYSDEVTIAVSIQTGVSHPPIAIALPEYQEVQIGETAFFDGSESYCPDGCSPQNPLTYRWYIHGIEIQPQLQGMKVNYTFTEAGFYTVSLYVFNSENPHEISSTESIDECIVHVTESPVNHPPFAIATPFHQGGTIGENLLFNGTQSYDPDDDSLEYLWDFGDKTTGSGAVVTHRFSNPSTSPDNPPSWNFTITLTVSDGQFSDRDACLVTISETTIYLNKLNELAHWRAEYSRFDVAVVCVNDLSYWSADPSNPELNNDITIKNFIDYVYHNWSAPHMSDNHVGYILLVGSTSFVTSHFNYNSGEHQWYPTDKSYVYIDGDDTYPDIMIGRFSINDWNELSIVAEKTIQYEKNPEPGDWQKNVLLCEGLRDYALDEGNRFPDYSRVTETLLGLGGWNVSTVFWEDGGTANDIVNEINEGKHIVVYCDHGGEQEWSYIDFNVYHIQQLTNAKKLPLVYSLACYTGGFQDENECMGEAFLNNPNGGAIAFWGASTIASYEAPFFTYLFDSMFENFTYIVGEIITEGIIKMNGGFAEFNLLGDPAVDLSGSTRHPNKPDLAISPLNITLDPDNPTREDHEIYITAEVLNIGGGTAKNVRVQFIVNDMFGETRVIGEQVIPEISPGKWSTLTQLWNTSTEPAKKSLIIKIDPNNTIDEAYELNNQAGVKVVITSNVTYVDDDYYDGGSNDGHTWGYDAFNKVQDGIDVAANGGTTIVHSGTYYEHITIKKTITLRGDDRDTTIIDGNEIGKVVTLIGTYVNISGFTIRHSGHLLFDSGIYSIASHLSEGCYSDIFGNIIAENLNGICPRSSYNNLITGNIIRDNSYGIGCGSSSIQGDSNKSGNQDSNGNKNDLHDGIYHNNFINNTQHAFSGFMNWDGGYPLGGNYWDDNPNFIDEFSGPYQNESGSDGICDTPYVICSECHYEDHYPLMNLFILGDMNTDGIVNFDDINPFDSALTNPETYRVQYSMLPSLHGDINQDGTLDFGDINPFVALLSSGHYP